MMKEFWDWLKGPAPAWVQALAIVGGSTLAGFGVATFFFILPYIVFGPLGPPLVLVLVPGILVTLAYLNR